MGGCVNGWAGGLRTGRLMVGGCMNGWIDYVRVD